MSIEINDILKDMAARLNDEVKQETGDIKDYTKEILDAEKDSLAELAEALLKKEIDQETFDREIKREKKVVEAKMLTLKIMSKALAQKAINAAFDVFVSAIKAAL